MLVLALYSAEIFKFRSSGWLSKIINKVSLSSSYGAISTGLISGILAAPCTGPLLAAILAFAAGSPDKTRGIFLLVFYSFGFCTPFLFLSFFPRLINIMPKSGYWLHAVKFIIAVCLLSIAFDYLDINNFIPVLLSAFVDSKILLAVNLALFLLSIKIFLKLHRKNQQKLNLMALCISAYLLFLVQLELRNKYQDYNFAIAKSYNLESLDSKPKILFFTADWCAKCPQIKHYLSTDPEVITELTNFQLIEVDLTQISESEKKLQSKYEIKGLPSLVFTCSDLQEINTPKLQDVASSIELLHKLKQAGQIAKSCAP